MFHKEGGLIMFFFFLQDFAFFEGSGMPLERPVLGCLWG